MVPLKFPSLEFSFNVTETLGLFLWFFNLFWGEKNLAIFFFFFGFLGFFFPANDGKIDKWIVMFWSKPVFSLPSKNLMKGTFLAVTKIHWVWGNIAFYC